VVTIKKWGVETALIVLLVMLAFYTWTRPLNGLPFGDVDSSVHFSSGDYMGQTNTVFVDAPRHLDFFYGADAQGRLPYPPQFATNEAIFQQLSGSRFDGVFLFIAMASFSFVFGSYLLIRRLFGFMAAFLSSLMLVFSVRHYMTYLWGQWPQAISFAFIPVILYAFFMYSSCKMSNGRKATHYLIVLGLLIAFQYTFHPQSMVIVALFLGFYTLMVYIFTRRSLLRGKEIMAVGATIIFMFLIAPYQARVTLGQLGIIDTGATSVQEGGVKLQFLGTLLEWYPSEGLCRQGCVPESYFSYKEMHNGYWTMPFLLLGLLTMVLRRKKEDLFLLAYFVPIYLTMHLGTFNITRAHRFFMLEAELFYPIIAVGFLGLFSLVKGKASVSRLKWLGLVAFAVIVLVLSTPPALNILGNAYTGIGRITPAQLAAVDWARSNLPDEADMLIIGVSAPAKGKWMSLLGHRHGIFDYNLWGVDNPDYNMTDHVMMDYSDFLAMGRQDVVQAMQQYEQQNLAGAKLLYDQNNIRIYSLENDTEITPNV
jgi:hypothetical protein